eukprot:TRINITY_DN11686_c0_g2_i2.p2 TRINITY_DN11686_c0_g2~~TRINITY_DN11686_c0_g2_i2.p2  ORF type:complete len:114 (+),score=11.83 TRINITY_DN11686_c0_g2_i2:265-606(+)
MGWSATFPKIYRVPRARALRAKAQVTYKKTKKKVQQLLALRKMARVQTAEQPRFHVGFMLSTQQWYSLHSHSEHTETSASKRAGFMLAIQRYHACVGLYGLDVNCDAFARLRL